MSKEKWRWVKGCEGLYMVSNKGRVMSVPKSAEKSNGVVTEYDGTVLKSALNRGYEIVALSCNGELKTKAVHRLVAEAFVNNSGNLPSVNHIDENKQNNTAENLEWCSVEYNNSYGTRNSRISKTLSKPVQMILAGKVIKDFPSMSSAQMECGVRTSHISECCTGKRKTAAGYEWRYKEVI